MLLMIWNNNNRIEDLSDLKYLYKYINEHVSIERY
jgi:hypothetical protein